MVTSQPTQKSSKFVILSIAKDLIAGEFWVCCGKRFFAEFTLSEANVLRMTGL